MKFWGHSGPGQAWTSHEHTGGAGSASNTDRKDHPTSDTSQLFWSAGSQFARPTEKQQREVHSSLLSWFFSDLSLLLLITFSKLL